MTEEAECHGYMVTVRHGIYPEEPFWLIQRASPIDRQNASLLR